MAHVLMIPTACQLKGQFITTKPGRVRLALWGCRPRWPRLGPLESTHESSSHTHRADAALDRRPAFLHACTHTHTRTRTRAAPDRLTWCASITTSTSAGPDTDARTVLRLVLHISLSALATPSHSNHTFSPYTLAPSNFTIRSGPQRAPPAPPCAPPRTRCRCTHVLGANVQPQEGEAAAGRDSGDEGEGADADSVEPPSEFDEEDMDRYFRMRDELASVAVSDKAGVRHWFQFQWDHLRTSHRTRRSPA